jgi:glycosyltransferase involved in cell wall biosynthesis
MNVMKLLSIVVPALNEEKYLPLLLNSLVNQTDKNFEVIVADGKSEDDTAKLADGFKNQLDIKVIEVEKRNVAHQRNTGAKNAVGDYIVFMDADFIVKDDFVKSCFEESAKTDADLIIPSSMPITNNWLWKIYFSIINFFCALSSFSGKPFGNGPGNIVKKDAFLKTGGYNEEVFVFEDQYFFTIAKRHHLKIKDDGNIEMYFSLRRLQKDGVLGYFYFNFSAAIRFILKGPVYKKFYDYQMGGQEFKK